MKITKRQLRRIIREELQLEMTSYEKEVGEPSEFIEANWILWAKENDIDPARGAIFDDLARYLGAQDRSWLDAKPPAAGPIATEIEEFVRMTAGHAKMRAKMSPEANKWRYPERKWD